MMNTILMIDDDVALLRLTELNLTKAAYTASFRPNMASPDCKC